MKRIYNVFLFIAIIGAFSCKKDFIALTPVDAYTTNNFYKTEQQFESAMVAAYAPLRDVLINDYFTSEMHSDNTIYQPVGSNVGTAYVYRENISDFLNTSVNSYVNATWQHSYTGISRCNIIIQSLPGSNITDSIKKNIDGQAKFLRALNYFKLVRLYGAIPLFLKVVTTANDAFIPRTSVDSVYMQIVSDAKDAMDELAPPAKFPQTGVATKGAATMLLADVYATQKKWTEVEQLLKTLPAMGYDLNSNYDDAFDPLNKNSKESIFEVQFLGGDMTGSTPNALSIHFIPRSTNTKLLTGIVINNTGSGGWNTPTKDLISSFEPGDKRLDASIGIIEGIYDGSDYLNYTAVKSISDSVPAAGATAIPYIKKYMHSPLPATSGSSDDFPIYRYSEALLLLSESLNEQGRPSEALIPLNRVRARAGLDPITETNQSSLRKLIFHERRVELAFENHRWEDLLREGDAVNIINTVGKKIKVDAPYTPAGAYNIDDHNLLFPIPQTDLDLNSLLFQNPGY